MATTDKHQTKAEVEYNKLREAVISQALERDGKVDRKLMAEKAAAFQEVRNEQRAQARKEKESLQAAYIRDIPEVNREKVAARLRGEKHHEDKK